jgi:hypothetical protein
LESNIEENSVNKAIGRNIIGKVDTKYIDNKYDDILQKRISDYKKKHGMPPSEEKLASIVKRTEDEKRAEEKTAKVQQMIKQQMIVGTAVENAGKQTAMQFLGNVIMFMVKPLYYETNDILRNGLCEGVGTEIGKEALAIRFGRVKNYVIDHLKSIKSLSVDVLQLLKDFLLAVIEGFINMFVGLLKQILKVIKEGAKILYQSWNVLFGEQSKVMSAREKGDAILKNLGGSITVLCGVGIDYLLNKIPGLPEDIRRLLSTVFTGIAATLVVYMLDRIDLFNVKEEKRKARMNELNQLNLRLLYTDSARTIVSTIKTDVAMRTSYEYVGSAMQYMGTMRSEIKKKTEENYRIDQDITDEVEKLKKGNDKLKKINKYVNDDEF